MRKGKTGALLRVHLAMSLLVMTLVFVGCASGEGREDSDEYSDSVEESGVEAVIANKTEDVSMDEFTLDTTVAEVVSDDAFEGFGRLLFPVDRYVDGSLTLQQVTGGGVYVWYSAFNPERTVEVLNRLKADAQAGHQVFHPIYSESEIAADPSKADTGLFFFRGDEGAETAIMNAGGGFSYVAALHDSFPHALEVSKLGYNAFALIYRPDDPYADLARAIAFLHDNADDLGITFGRYSLWGGSAGARMAATLGNADNLVLLTGRSDIDQAAAVITQYTGYSAVSPHDAPTYVCVGMNDGIANWRGMQSRLDTLSAFGIPTEFHAYEGLSHGFGLGTGTKAEGWINDAIAFWENQM